MIAYLTIAGISLMAAGLTLFSGFGLGTVLLPAFAFFFPIPVAIAATAAVHLFNNLFKLVLVGRSAHPPTVVRFGLPAAVGSLVGAAVLSRLGAFRPLHTYDIGGHAHELTPLRLTIGLMMITFALIELVPRLGRLAVDRRFLVPGGMLSGFFGGLSGHQGALRSIFLIHCGLEKEAFIGTGVVVAVIVDICRLAVYGATFLSTGFGAASGALTVATIAAFVGSFIGARLIGKTTLRGVQIIVGWLLMGTGAAMAAGVI